MLVARYLAELRRMHLHLLLLPWHGRLRSGDDESRDLVSLFPLPTRIDLATYSGNSFHDYIGSRTVLPIIQLYYTTFVARLRLPASNGVLCEPEILRGSPFGIHYFSRVFRYYPPFYGKVFLVFLCTWTEVVPPTVSSLFNSIAPSTYIVKPFRYKIDY